MPCKIYGTDTITVNRVFGYLIILYLKLIMGIAEIHVILITWIVYFQIQYLSGYIVS